MWMSVGQIGMSWDPGSRRVTMHTGAGLSPRVDRGAGEGSNPAHQTCHPYPHTLTHSNHNHTVTIALLINPLSANRVHSRYQNCHFSFKQEHFVPLDMKGVNLKQVADTSFKGIFAGDVNWHLFKLLYSLEGGGPRVVVSTAAFYARVRGSVPGLGGLKETNYASSPSTWESQYCGEPP